MHVIILWSSKYIFSYIIFPSHHLIWQNLVQYSASSQEEESILLGMTDICCDTPSYCLLLLYCSGNAPALVQLHQNTSRGSHTCLCTCAKNLDLHTYWKSLNYPVITHSVAGCSSKVKEHKVKKKWHVAGELFYLSIAVLILNQTANSDFDLVFWKTYYFVIFQSSEIF